MLRHAGISEIYTREHPLLLFLRPSLPVHNLCYILLLVSFVFYRPFSVPFPFSLAMRRQRGWVIQWFVLLITELRGRHSTIVPSSRREERERVEWTSATPEIAENKETAFSREKHASACVELRSFLASYATYFIFSSLRGRQNVSREESIFSSLSSRDLLSYFSLTSTSCYCRHRCRASVAFLMQEKYSIVHCTCYTKRTYRFPPRTYKAGWQGIPVHFPRFSPLAGAIQQEINLARINRAKRCACLGAVRVTRATWRRRDRNMHFVRALRRVVAVRIMNPVCITE